MEAHGRHRAVRLTESSAESRRKRGRFRSRATAKERAEGLLDLLLRYGSTHIRSHCNVDPVVGLRNLEATLQAVEGYREKAFVEIVAFHSMACFATSPSLWSGMRSGTERRLLVVWIPQQWMKIWKNH